MTASIIPPLRRAAALPSMALALLLLVPALAQARGAPDSFADEAERLLPAVVNISTTQTVQAPAVDMPQFPPGSPFEEFFKQFRGAPGQEQGPPRHATALGSGFIIDSSGYVVTNNHVIDGAEEIEVILHDDTRLPAKLIGTDDKTDIALLKVESDKPLPAVGWGDSDKLRVGDWVLAIGNPFGLGGTVTAGIVSARGRNINAGPYDDFIQTDASINRGNSGGPMFDSEGKVVGVNTAIFSPSGGNIGIGFAVPSSMAEPVVAQLKETGRVTRGWLGVSIQTVTEEIAEGLGMAAPTGALIAQVQPDGPAEKAGLKQGDVVLRFDGKTIGEMRELPRVVAQTDVGRTVPVDILRGGKERTVSVKVAEMSDPVQVSSRPETAPKPGTDDSEIAALGMKVAPLDAATRDGLGLAADAEGMVIASVDPNGPAAEKGLRQGDLITQAERHAVTSAEDLRNAVEEAGKEGRKAVLLLVDRANQPLFVAIRIDEGKSRG
jgi:serine protease Do